ncbi:tyrosine-protein phosphatase [Microbacterium sp.]|uniref:tyrosine-protein phosphatase n=1 Tax=Microbacterium sp. TaxID=51671 RepID=UPI003F9B1CCC
MNIEGCYNSRDTAGTPLTSGGVTRAGVLYRSDALSNLTPNGLDQLAQTNVGVIVDFRTAEERQAGPDKIPDSRPFRTVELSFLEGAMSDMAKNLFSSGGPLTPEQTAQVAASIPTLGDLYIGMLQGGASSFAQVARLIAEGDDSAPSGVLVHCTVGKDRTGVATALMLEAAGAERSAVVADYAASQENLAGPWAEGMLRMVESFGIPTTPELTTLVCGTPPEAIESALNWVDTQAGGAAEYLRSGGLTSDELSALRARFTA